MSNGPHQMPVQDAAALTLRWRRSRPTGGLSGGRFDRIAFDNILSQPGCMGIRIYMGLHDPSDPNHKGDPSMWTFVLVGTDANGNDIATLSAGMSAGSGGGDTEQNPILCPPSCGTGSPLNSPP
jgi:hypothetical protein